MWCEGKLDKCTSLFPLVKFWSPRAFSAEYFFDSLDSILPFYCVVICFLVMLLWVCRQSGGSQPRRELAAVRKKKDFIWKFFSLRGRVFVTGKWKFLSILSESRDGRRFIGIERSSMAEVFAGKKGERRWKTKKWKERKRRVTKR